MHFFECKENSAPKRRRGMQPQSFLDFYLASKDSCFRALYVTVQSAHKAEDLLTESFTRVLEDWKALAEHPAKEVWIVRTALNLHRDRWRRAVKNYLPYGCQQLPQIARLHI
jgi:DNA-directed RNA polymerase specialized sigma24 family protein